MIPTTRDDTLAHLEHVIEQGLETFIEVGQALITIRDKQLYLPGYSSWTEYLLRRWGLSRQRAHQVMVASDVALSLPGAPAQLKESHARALAQTPDYLRPVVLGLAADAVARANMPLSASAIKRARQHLDELAATGAISYGHEQVSISQMIVDGLTEELLEGRKRQIAHIQESRPVAPVFRGDVVVVGGRLSMSLPDGCYTVVVYPKPLETE